MIFTYVVFLHNRQADCAADHCVMNTITADSVEDAETRILEHYAANDPEIITVIEGDHADALDRKPHFRSHTMSLSTYRDRPHWSYSSLNQLLNICSLQYFFEKVERRPKPFRPLALVFGSTFHRVMEFIALARQKGNQPTVSEVKEWFQETWKAEQNADLPLEQTEDDPAALGDQGAALVAAYLESIDPEERVVAISKAFAVPVGSSERPLIGEIDCITERNGMTELVDWKTSARRWPKDQADKSLQPTVYLFGMSQIQPGNKAGFRFDVAVKNKTPVIERNYTTRRPDDFTRLIRLVEKAEQIVQHELFYPSDQSFACNGCPFQEPCHAWHRQQARTTVNLAA